MLHQDVGQIFKSEKTPEGFLRVWLTVSRIGDLKYYNNDGTERIETLTGEELFNKDSLDTAWGKPITLNHPDEEEGVTSKNFKKYAVGLTQQGMVVNGDFLTIVGVLTDPDAIAIAKKGAEVSAGYHTELVEKGGKLHQTKRRYNHFAVLSGDRKGRAGKDVRIHADAFRCDAIAEEDLSLDRYWSTKARENLPENQFAGSDRSYPISNAEDIRNAWSLAGQSKGLPPDDIRRNVIRIAKRLNLTDALPKTAVQWAREKNIRLDRRNPIMQKITLDSIEYEVEDRELTKAIIALNNDRDAKISELQQAKVNLAEKEATIASLEQQQETLRAERNDATIGEEIKERLQLWQEIGDRIDFDPALSSLAIKRKYLDKVSPDLVARTDGYKSEPEKEAWLSGLYELKKPSQDRDRQDAIDKTNEHLNQLNNNSKQEENLNPLEKARINYTKRVEGASRDATN